MQALLDWSFQSIGEKLIALVLVDRDGLVIDSRLKEGVDEEVLGGLAALVEPILKRVSSEFKSGSFGAGTFDTDKYRLLFCEAGPNSIIVIVADSMASVDNLFPYAYLIAEKVARLVDDRPVSPVIPVFNEVGGELEGSEDIARLLIEKGSYVLKTVLLGDGGVGKTTLVTQFVSGSFQDDYKSTIGVQIMKKAVNFDQWDVEVRLTIFDLAGQDQFARVRQTYFKGAKAGFIIFDVTRPETFGNVEQWHQACLDIEPDIMLILIANKIDLEDNRQITGAQGKALADKLGISYMETSALNKDIVDEAFRTLAFMFITPYKASTKL
jgi:small GTP-binding protein